MSRIPLKLCATTVSIRLTAAGVNEAPTIGPESIASALEAYAKDLRATPSIATSDESHHLPKIDGHLIVARIEII